MAEVSKEEVEAHILPAEVHEEVIPRKYLVEESKSAVKDYFVGEKINESTKIVNKYLVSGPPTMEYSFEIGVSIK